MEDGFFYSFNENLLLGCEDIYVWGIAKESLLGINWWVLLVDDTLEDCFGVPFKNCSRKLLWILLDGVVDDFFIGRLAILFEEDGLEIWDYG